MNLYLRVLWGRTRRAKGLALLRLVGLALAALVAASVPAFVNASMERVLQRELAAMAEPPGVILSWTAPDEKDYGVGLRQVTEYLGRALPREAGGLRGTELVSIPSTGQRAVQQVQPDGRVRAARRYFTVGILPDGIVTAAGRLPAPGAPEVVVAAESLARAGYQIGDQLRLPLTATSGTPSVDVTVVGTFRLPDEGKLSHLAGSLTGMMLTSDEFWRSLDVPVGEQVWALDLARADLHTTGLNAVADALNGLPLRTAGLLPGVEIVATPLPWMLRFLHEMSATRQLLVVLLTPIYLLVLFFTLATAAAVVSGRRVEVAVLRSRGLSPLEIGLWYAGESLLLVALATGTALLLVPPAVRVMGLFAGFLQLVGRPPLPVTVGWETLLYALGAAALAELIATVPLLRAARLTVATMRQEAETKSPVLAALRVMAELLLFGLVLYGSWRLLKAGRADEPLYLALPALALVAAGAAAWRLVELVLAGAVRLLGPWLSPPLHLALSLLRHQPVRYQALWLMLVVTAGLGIYGAAFARTLDRDLAAQVRYRLGADLVLRPAWESEVLSVDAEGNPDEVVWREPPFRLFEGLPGAASVARVQHRSEVTLLAGTRNLGRFDVIGIHPQEFGLTARFLPDLTPMPPADYLNALAAEEQAVLVSAEMAGRLGIKPGDQLRLRQSGVDLPVYVAAVIPYFPGRLPGDGPFIIANIDYLQDWLELLPYDVWIRMASGASLTPLVEELTHREIRLLTAADRLGTVASGRREPLRLALYATLSSGFLIALLVMALTYLLNAGLELQSRAKELGVLRAMGLRARQVAASLYTEQLLMVGTAALTGLAVGSWAAGIYVPVLRQQPGAVLLPLPVASAAGERIFLLTGFALSLVLGAAVVATWLRRLEIGKVLRLGEDG